MLVLIGGVFEYLKYFVVDLFAYPPVLLVFHPDAFSVESEFLVLEIFRQPLSHDTEEIKLFG